VKELTVEERIWLAKAMKLGGVIYAKEWGIVYIIGTYPSAVPCPKEFNPSPDHKDQIYDVLVWLAKGDDDYGLYVASEGKGWAIVDSYGNYAELTKVNGRFSAPLYPTYDQAIFAAVRYVMKEESDE